LESSLLMRSKVSFKVEKPKVDMQIKNGV